jgi:hypothetical protein
MQAQAHELNDMLNLIRETVDAVALPASAASTGRPRENQPTDGANAPLLQGYFNCSTRLASGYALVFAEKLGITKPLNYKAIERAYEDADVKHVIAAPTSASNEPRKATKPASPRTVAECFATGKATGNATRSRPTKRKSESAPR